MRAAAFAAVLAIAASTAHAQHEACVVAPYRGASSPEGAVTEVRMHNNGFPCVMPNYGAPNATYVPVPGFAGDDDFQYEAYVRGGGGTSVRLLVTVKVRVQPPR